MAMPNSVGTQSPRTVDASRIITNTLREQPCRPSSPRLAYRLPVQPETWKYKNFSASQNYEAALGEPALHAHLGNQQRIAQAIAELREKFAEANPDGSPAEFRKRVESSLETLLAEAAFDTSPYLSKTTNPDAEGFIHGYGKYLLYGDDNLDAPFCLQYFHFSPGQKTPIHDHPVPCISLVVRGQLAERHYSAVSATEARKTGIAPRAFLDRKSILDVGVPNIHSLKNKYGDVAGSVHFYYIDGDINSRAVRTVYQKAARDSNQTEDALH